MKLINNTRIPDDVLRPVLVAAGRSVRARTSKVVVQVNPGWGIRGTAYDCGWVRWGNRRRKRGKMKVS